MIEPDKVRSRISQLLPAGFARAKVEPIPFEGGSTGRGVYTLLRERIVTLDLPPGTPVSRAEMAQTYGISLTPLRDALQQLAKEGLVEIFPQSRTLVTTIDVSAVREAQFLRLALETEVVGELAEKITPEDLHRLRTISSLQASTGEKVDDVAIFQELDELFHQTLFLAAGHVHSQRLMRSQAGHLERLRRLHLNSNDETARLANNRAIIEGHGAIIEGIAARDKAQAVAALRNHLRRTIDRLAEKRAAFPTYFRPD